MTDWSVWKVVVEGTGQRTVSVPKGAEFFSVGIQDQNIVVWFGCDTAQPLEDRKLFICLTGGAAPPPAYMGFVGTVTFDRPSGPYVLHVFAERRK